MTVAIITGGASGMGDEFATRGARAIVITEPSSSLSDLSLSLLVVGWDCCCDCCWLAEICGSALMWVTKWVLGGVDVDFDVGFGSALWVWDLGWVKVDEGCYGWSRSVKVAIGVCLMKWWIGGFVCLFESVLNRWFFGIWVVGDVAAVMVGGYCCLGIVICLLLVVEIIYYFNE